MCVYPSHKKEALKSLRQEQILGVGALRETWDSSIKENEMRGRGHR